MDKYKITLETWNKVASLYQEKFMFLDIYNETYSHFCHLVKNRGNNILEIGCGPGNITSHLVAFDSKFSITAIDAAPEMIRLAEKNNPSVQHAVMDCRDLSSINEIFDGIIVGFCIPYLSKEDCILFFDNCTNLLQPQGILYVSSIKGDYSNSGFETASTGDKSFVHYYNEAFFDAIFLKNNLSILHKFEINYPAKINQVHLVYIVQKL